LLFRIKKSRIKIMKATVLQENLDWGFSIVSRIADSNTNLPILANILLEIQEGKIKLTATDLETGINVWVPAKKGKEGKFTVPGKDLTDFVSSLPSKVLEIEKKKEKIKVSTEGYNAVFNGLAAAEFPKVPNLRDGKKTEINKKFKLDALKFVKAVKKVCFAAAVDETRPVLTGVRIKIDNKKMQMVATDGFRLSLEEISLEEEIEAPVLIVPARTLMEMVRIIESEGVEEDDYLKAALTKEDNQIIFAFNNVELAARLIEGDFPEFQKIIPEKGESKAVVSKDELEKAVRSASIFARKSSNIIKLEFSKDFLEIKANSPEVGKNKVRISSELKGEEKKIAFNYRFLADFLKNVQGDEVFIELSDPLKPGLFKMEEKTSFIHIIMPVRLQE